VSAAGEQALEAHRRRRFADVAVGETLPGHTVPITLQRLVMEAGANRDFAPIHFDREAATVTGAPDVYANTIFLEAVIESSLRRWGGLDAWIREIAFTMRGFNCVGDTVTAGGRVLALHPDEHMAELDIWIESERGRTVEGSAKVRFPTEGKGGSDEQRSD
jgi:acyl dehydratase